MKKTELYEISPDVGYHVPGLETSLTNIEEVETNE